MVCVTNGLDPFDGADDKWLLCVKGDTFQVHRPTIRLIYSDFAEQLYILTKMSVLRGMGALFSFILATVTYCV